MLVWLLLALPGVLRANVSISEIAWMGSADNANAEWIELYNDGASVDLTGWTLSSADGQPSIPLTGTIAGNAYFVLERTSDDTVPGVTAGQVYTGAMGNTGEVFALTDGAGTVVDRVDGSGDWAIGGDNTSKLTLQRSGGGFVTAQATPGRSNASSDDAGYVEQQAADAETEANTDTSTDTGSTKSTSAPKKSKEVNMPPSLEPTLSIELGSDITVAAGVPLTLSAEVRKEGGKPLELNTLTWNFGDGATGDGQKIVHTYLYPGEYVVKIRGTRSLLRPPVTDEDQLTVHVVPLMLGVSHADSESIELTNDSAYDVDVSRFALTAGKKYFRIPEGTTLLKNARIRFASTITKLKVTDPHSVGIFTPGNVLASTFSTGGSALGVAQGTESTYATATLDFVTAPENEEMSIPPLEEGDFADAHASDTPSLLPATVAYADTGTTQKTSSQSLLWWLLGLAALVGTTATALILARRERAEIIEGFEIESDE